MTKSQRKTNRLAVLGLVLMTAQPASAQSVGEPVTQGLRLGYERAFGSEAYAPQALTAEQPQIDRVVARLLGRVSSDWSYWLDVARGAYQFADQDFPGTTHLRHETRLQAGVSRGGVFPAGAWSIGAGYGVHLLQVQNSARLTDSEPAFFFLPWQLLHGVTLSESVRVGFGPLSLVLDGRWDPFLFAHMADSRLAMPAYLTAFRVAPRLSIWSDRLSLGYAFEGFVGDGFQRRSEGPFVALAVTGF